MSNWEWPSEADKVEAIGYLAVEGVVGSIEATVPIGKTEEFRKAYKGKYSEEYPYEANKFGRQFRIYLNDTEGCPDFLKEHLDGTYGNRINNTAFIDELVTEYGFKFTKEPQDSESIKQIVFKKHSGKELDAFRKGFEGYRDFVDQIEEYVDSGKSLTSPNVLEYEEKSISRRTEKNSESTSEGVSSGYTPNQTMRLGWSGENYIAYLLKSKDESILKSLDIPVDADYEVEWFNEGVQNAEINIETTGTRYNKLYIEKVKKWTDQSVGKGCDITVTLDNGDTVYIEVKTSKRAYPYFNMTSVEMQEMELRGDQYALVKVNNFEKVLKSESPDIITIINPFEKLFHPKQMKDATFVVGGK